MAWRRLSSNRMRGSGASEPGAQGAVKCLKCWDQTEPLLSGEKHGLCAKNGKKVVRCFPWKQADVHLQRFVRSLPWEIFHERKCQLRVMPAPPHVWVAPVKMVMLLAVCVLAPGETVQRQEENWCSKGRLALFKQCSTKRATVVLVEQKELAVCRALGWKKVRS